MIIPMQAVGASRTVSAAPMSEAGLGPQFLGGLFRKAGKATRPVIRGPVRLLSEGAHNQVGDLPTTAARTGPVALAGNRRVVLSPVIEGNPLGTGGGYAAGGDEYPCGTCADGSVMWCDAEGNSYGCWD